MNCIADGCGFNLLGEEPESWLKRDGGVIDDDPLREPLATHHSSNTDRDHPDRPSLHSRFTVYHPPEISKLNVIGEIYMQRGSWGGHFESNVYCRIDPDSVRRLEEKYLKQEPENRFHRDFRD